jgi:hypothetical protein
MALTPRKLAAISRQAEKERERQSQLEEDRKRKNEEARRVHYKREVPIILKKFEAALLVAAKDKKRSIEFEYADVIVSDDPRLAAIEDYCKKNKLKCNTSYKSGTSNMGDFNAPCYVDWKSYLVEVSW